MLSLIIAATPLVSGHSPAQIEEDSLQWGEAAIAQQAAQPKVEIIR